MIHFYSRFDQEDAERQMCFAKGEGRGGVVEMSRSVGKSRIRTEERGPVRAEV